MSWNDLLFAISDLPELQQYVLINSVIYDLTHDPELQLELPEELIEEELEELNVELENNGEHWSISEIKVEPTGELYHWEKGQWQPTGLYFGRDSWS